jgi:hypothetical protein
LDEEALAALEARALASQHGFAGAGGAPAAAAAAARSPVAPAAAPKPAPGGGGAVGHLPIVGRLGSPLSTPPPEEPSPAPAVRRAPVRPPTPGEGGACAVCVWGGGGGVTLQQVYWPAGLLGSVAIDWTSDGVQGLFFVMLSLPCSSWHLPVQVLCGTCSRQVSWRGLLVAIHPLHVTNKGVRCLLSTGHCALCIPGIPCPISVR